MNIITKSIFVGTVVLGLAACSTTGSRGAGSGSDMYGEGGMGANGGGAYSEGMGNGGGFQPATNCNVPANATQSYYFDYDSSGVHPDDTTRLSALANNLAANSAKVKVVGNTDNRGSREYNIALGWRRADAVASALEQAGVSKNNVNKNSNGAEKPIAFGDSADDYQCNRRVDVMTR